MVVRMALKDWLTSIPWINKLLKYHQLLLLGGIGLVILMI